MSTADSPTMSSDLGMEPYTAVPYQEPPHNTLTDALHNDALMSPSFAYPDPNGGLWRMINTLPQLINATDVPSHDGFASVTSVKRSHATSSHRGAYTAPARPSTSTTTRSPHHINTEPLTAPKSHIPHSSAPKQAQLPTSELHLCKTCCTAVQALARYVLYFPSRRMKTKDIQLRYHNPPRARHLLYLSR